MDGAGPPDLDLSMIPSREPATIPSQPPVTEDEFRDTEMTDSDAWRPLVGLPAEKPPIVDPPPFDRTAKRPPIIDPSTVPQEQLADSQPTTPAGQYGSSHRPPAPTGDQRIPSGPYIDARQRFYNEKALESSHGPDPAKELNKDQLDLTWDLVKEYGPNIALKATGYGEVADVITAGKAIWKGAQTYGDSGSLLQGLGGAALNYGLSKGAGAAGKAAGGGDFVTEQVVGTVTKAAGKAALSAYPAPGSNVADPATQTTVTALPKPPSDPLVITIDGRANTEVIIQPRKGH